MSKQCQAVASIILVLASVAGFAAAAPKKPQCVPAQGRATYTVESRCLSMEYDGTRTYRLYTPRPTRKQALPVMLVLHGGGGSGSAMEALTLGHFNRLADQHGVLIVYPDGIGRSWNDGRSDLRSAAAQEYVDDVGFLRTLVSELGKQQAIQISRVYATGMSNGGLMAYRLACDAADFVAAVAPVAANLSVELARECRPSRAVPMAIINGTDDPMMPWIGGDIKVLFSRRGEVLSAQESFEYFARIGDCALPITHSPQDRVPDDRTKVIRHVARECRNGGEVRLYEILGGGHTWPSGNAYLGPRLVGRVSRELNAANEIWNFVSKYSLP